MKRLLMLVGLLALAACQYDTPLTKGPGLPVDSKLAGSWDAMSGEQNPERLVILPLDANEYLVEYPAGADAMYFRAITLTNAVGNLAQLKLLGSRKGAAKSDTPPYQIMSWKLAGDTLTLAVLNEKAVGGKHATPEAFAKAIAEHSDDAALFNEPASFKRVP